MSIGTSVAAQAHDVFQKQDLQVTRLPAPNKGIDTRSAIGKMSMDHCIYAFNLVPHEYGMRVRDGYREWATGLTDGGTQYGVHTLIVFDGTVTEPSDNRLFAVTNEGIWDITVVDTPVLKYAFVIDTTANAGYGVYAHYIERDGTEYLYYADSKNGLFQYNAATDIWAPATGITGPDLTKVDFVVVHKQRIWLIEQDSNIGWYLPVASAAGTATEFFFGPKFNHGGKLKALINWSVDGGGGVDDYLVAVSSAGDVIPYRGSDPSIVQGPDILGGWTVVGTYFIGKIPEGKKFFSEYSGEMYILSSFGLISMSDLLRGVDPADVSADSLTFPIASIIRNEMSQTYEQYGWEPVFLPSQGVLLIQSPFNVATGKYIQFSMNLTLQSWGIWRDVPMTAFVEWDTTVYFGTADSRVCVMDVPVDNILIDTNDPEAAGAAIQFSILTGFSDAGAPGLFKIPQYVRCDFLSGALVAYNTRFVFDYEIEEQSIPIPPLPTHGSGTWNVGLWDQAIWGSGTLVPVTKTQGGAGIGRVMAIAVQGKVTNRTRFLSMDAMWKQGGPL
jgi:hypothetical protein